MEVRISKNGKIGIIQSIILILFGVFLTTFLFAVIIRIFGQETYSLWIGLITNLAIAVSGIYFCKNKSLRLISYSIIGTVIVGIIIYIVLIQIASGMLEGI